MAWPSTGSVIRRPRKNGVADTIIVVANPRDPDGSRRGTGLGLDIVRRRLDAAFGDAAVVAIEAGAERYKVSVTIPVGVAEPAIEVRA